jgi:hypothetical protein
MSTITVAPRSIPVNRTGTRKLTLTLANAGWSGSTAFGTSGVAGVVQLTAYPLSSTTAVIVVSTRLATTPGVLTVTDNNGNSGTTKVVHARRAKQNIEPSWRRARAHTF